MNNLAPGLTENDIPAADDALDTLTIEDWAEHDLDGYLEACADAGEADLGEIVSNIIDRTADGWRAPLIRKMRERLEAEVQNDSPWVRKWKAKFEE